MTENVWNPSPKEDGVCICDKRVPSSDGVHTLVGKVYCPPKDVKVRGYFEIIHGMTEHIGRYDKFARSVAAAGFITFAYDQLGHGETAREFNDFGFIAHKNGWHLLVDDVKTFAAAVISDYSAQYGRLPYYLLGHSMGSFIVRLAAENTSKGEEEVTPTKIIVMGTGGPNPLAGAGLLVSDIVRLVKGEKYCSPLVKRLSMGSYNKRFKFENDSMSWLSLNASNRDTYRKDPLCNFDFTVSAMHDLVNLLKHSNSRSWARNFTKTMPALFISGMDDPVGDFSRGVTKSYEMLRSEGVPVTHALYAGYRHELLQEDCRDEVTQVIVNYISE